MKSRSLTYFAVLAALAGALLPLSLAAVAGGCGGTDTTPGAGGGGGGPGSDAGPVTTTLHPGAAPLPGETECKVVEVTNLPVAVGQHLPVCTPISYPTNPPSGGPHWPVWAGFSKYSQPVPREMLVHDEEHGAVVLFYRCKDDCPDVRAALEKSFDDAADTFCLANSPTPVTRVVLTPDPELPTPIAAAAWGATYVATCIDNKSLDAFILAHIGRGTEALCGGGEDPTLIEATCIDAGAGDDGGDGGLDGGDAGGG